ncbi:Acetate operon repressor [Pigmentiphaga humi]|uniref:Acetate operon repressor n=1 Tax=Pigmentiphaga humi TaxID=2478468 RepID=A0A3P4AWT9_9BURK|nr:IclR family transcriptional regulator [Pigmentiphaga humi]VCU68503.1 Acetate operon repressor [Pigmentiphaga humi]
MPTHRVLKSAADTAPRTPPRAPVRAMQVVEVLADSKESLSLAALSAHLGLPKTSLMHLLRALEASSHVVRTEAGYALGERSFRLAARIGARDFFETAAPQILRQIRQSTLETVLLARLTEDRRSAVYFLILPSPQPVRFVPEVEEPRPLHATAAGKLLLACSPEDISAEIIANLRLDRHTPNTIVSKAALRKHLAEIRTNGVSLSIDETAEGGSALSAPVYDQSGRLYCAVVIATPTARMKANQRFLRSVLVDGAARLSALKGYMNPPAARAG